MQKKSWETPQLIILARGTPEENVLSGCKVQNPNNPIDGPNLQASRDQCSAGSLDNCSPCSPQANSGS